MLPVSGFFIALYVGWVLPQHRVASELALDNAGLYRLWQFVLRFLAPLAVFIVFAAPLYKFLPVEVQIALSNLLYMVID